MKSDTPELDKALFNFQAKVVSVYADTSNDFFKSKYAPLDTVLKAIRPHMLLCGLLLSQEVRIAPDLEYGLIKISQSKKLYQMENKKPTDKEIGLARKHQSTLQTVITVVTSVTHVESGERVVHEASLPLDDNSPQPAGKIITYLRRYTIAPLLGFCDSDDNDGNLEGENPGITKPRFKYAYDISSFKNDAEKMTRVNKVIGKMGDNAVLEGDYVFAQAGVHALANFATDSLEAEKKVKEGGENE